MPVRRREKVGLGRRPSEKTVVYTLEVQRLYFPLSSKGNSLSDPIKTILCIVVDLQGNYSHLVNKDLGAP